MNHPKSNVERFLRDVCQPAGLVVTQAVQREEESAEYGACRVGINGRRVVFRVAKTTPKKIGQFVTLWKRPTRTGTIVPLDLEDGIDFVVVEVSDGVYRGFFIFDAATLAAQGVMAVNNVGGKRAFRVYPAWSAPTSRQALRTQRWQLPFLLPVAVAGVIDGVGEVGGVRALLAASSYDCGEVELSKASKVDWTGLTFGLSRFDSRRATPSDLSPTDSSTP